MTRSRHHPPPEPRAIGGTAPAPRPGAVGPYLRVAHAVSTSGCNAAEVIAGTPQRLRCHFFNADLLDAVPYSVDTNYEDLVPTGQIVKVRHQFTEPMTTGQYLTIAQRPDLRWTLIVWPCDPVEPEA